MRSCGLHFRAAIMTESSSAGAVTVKPSNGYPIRVCTLPHLKALNL